MDRRHFLVSYDISDDKRRNQVFKLLQAEGDHAQYSVFLCAMTLMELAQLRAELVAIIHHREDQVLILDLGPDTNPLEQGMEVLGSPFEPLLRTLVV